MTELCQIKKAPKWTVGYNIVSRESERWIGTGWEFFDDEQEAARCYDRHVSAGNCPFKRPYHEADFKHLGAVHQRKSDV